MERYHHTGAYFLIWILGLATTIQAAESKTSEERRAALERGEIVMDLKQHPATKVYLPTGQCLVEASMDEVWNIITDFDTFQEYLPHVVYYRPVCWKDNRLLVDCRVKVAGLGFEYRLAYDINEHEHATYWYFVSGPIRDSQGYWRIEPYDARRVLVTYTTTLDVGRAMPGFLERYLAKSTFPDIFNSLKKRVKELKAQGPIKKPVLTTKICPVS
jgi:ribosome-associated toxin RatA of RatAB toxin-antitoxin module